MAQVDDELAIRAVLADMTADQPPAPPHRYGAVRRKAVLQRRRTLAGAAAAVAILVFAALAIPLGLVHIGPQLPTGPRHYHVSEHPPLPGSQPGLVAYGVLNKYHWRATVTQDKHGVCLNAAFGTSAGVSGNCGGGPPTVASRSGDPVANLAPVGSAEHVGIATVRSDVAYVEVTYNDGTVLTAYPVGVFSRQYARYVALPAPYSAAVTEIIAYSRHGELGYTVPFTGGGQIRLVRWLRQGQPAMPRPATYAIGSGTLHGSRWHVYLRVGPWGTCFAAPNSDFFCFPATGSMLRPLEIARQFGLSYNQSTYGFAFGEATPSVQYLIVTTAHGSTARVPVVAAASRKFFAFSSVARDPVVQWAAYDATGRDLATGHVHD
jgi:hypothetical protein